jgi:hypothetical protein
MVFWKHRGYAWRLPEGAAGTEKDYDVCNLYTGGGKMALIDMVNRLAVNHNDRVRDAVTINAGVEAASGRRIRIRAGTTTVTLQGRPLGAPLGTPWTDIPLASVTLPQMTHFVNFLTQNSFLPGNHRGVLNNAAWQGFYHLANRALAYTNHANAAVANPAEPSVACYDCGLVLPTRNIQIDHQRPVEGNNTEAVCKVFRSIGLTVGAAAGPKGAHFAGIHRANVGGVVGAAGAATAAKYTLNNIGEIYLTVADWCGLLTGNHELDMACMNHIINLRPLCPACNTPNRNTPHFPVPMAM